MVLEERERVAHGSGRHGYHVGHVQCVARHHHF
jgi:hypothetical protein